MAQALITLEETQARIASGRPLLLAGDERVLRKLPAGEWIGGTIPYFMSERGGTFSQDLIFATEFPDDITSASIREYEAASLAQIYQDIPDNGFGAIILPGSSAILARFAIEAATYPGFGDRPLIGWVSGINLADVGTSQPRVFDGRTQTAYENTCVVLHVGLPATRKAEIGIVNPFHPDTADALQFPQQGFRVQEVLVNGQPQSFSTYLEEHHVNLQLPLVTENAEADINVSFESVDDQTGEVSFLAPVFPGKTYRLAQPIEDYVSAFEREVETAGLETGPVVVSCNCILNYLYSGLEGRHTEQFVGPITFGEVAHQLLNQTMVFLSVTNRLSGSLLLA